MAGTTSLLDDASKYVSDGLNSLTFKDIQTSIGKYVVSPLLAFGLGGFIFDVEGETQINLTADITDHFTEANFSVQDHIALKPKKIRLDTYVGELVYYGAGGKNSTIDKVARKIVTISSYLPALTSAASQAKSFYEGTHAPLSFNSVLDGASSIYGMVKNTLTPQTKQQQAYQYFKALYESKILMSLQTPFEFCTNMAIESITATQDEDTKFISNFSITLKEIRMVKTISVDKNTKKADGRTALQSVGDKIKGAVSGVEKSLTELTDSIGTALTDVGKSMDGLLKDAGEAGGKLLTGIGAAVGA